MDLASIFTLHNIALVLTGAVGLQILSFLGQWLSGSAVVPFIQAEITKAQQALEATSVGKITAQFHAESALFKLAEDEVSVVFSKLNAETQALIKSGDLTKVDWAAFGKDMWAGIRDQAQGGLNDYLAHSAIYDGATFCAKVAQIIFSKLHLTAAITAPIVVAAAPGTTTSTTAVSSVTTDTTTPPAKP